MAISRKILTAAAATVLLAVLSLQAVPAILSEDDARKVLQMADLIMERADAEFEEGEYQKAYDYFNRALDAYRQLDSSMPGYMNGLPAIRVRYCASQVTNAIVGIAFVEGKDVRQLTDPVARKAAPLVPAVPAEPVAEEMEPAASPNGTSLPSASVDAPSDSVASAEPSVPTPVPDDESLQPSAPVDAPSDSVASAEPSVPAPVPVPAAPAPSAPVAAPSAPVVTTAEPAAPAPSAPVAAPSDSVASAEPSVPAPPPVPAAPAPSAPVAAPAAPVVTIAEPAVPAPPPVPAAPAPSAPVAAPSAPVVTTAEPAVPAPPPVPAAPAPSAPVAAPAAPVVTTAEPTVPAPAVVPASSPSAKPAVMGKPAPRPSAPPVQASNRQADATPSRSDSAGPIAPISPDARNYIYEFNEARVLIEEGFLEQAAELLTPLLRQDPGNRSIRLMFAIIRTRQGRYDEAISALEDLRGRYEDLPILLAISGAYLGAGRYPDALLALDKAIRIAPEDPNAYMNLAWLSLVIPGSGRDALVNAEAYYRQAILRGAARDRTLEKRIGLKKW